MERRRFLAGAAAAGGAGLAGCMGGGGGSSDGWGDWFSNVDNYDGEVDRTASGEVTVEVGAGADGLAYAPAAVTVTTGTTVTWRWVDAGVRHNVVHTGDAFRSEYHDSTGATFAHTFESTGYYRYFCTPHEQLGMKGGVHVVEG